MNFSALNDSEIPFTVLFFANRTTSQSLLRLLYVPKFLFEMLRRPYVEFTTATNWTAATLTRGLLKKCAIRFRILSYLNFETYSESPITSTSLVGHATAKLYFGRPISGLCDSCQSKGGITNRGNFKKKTP